MSKDRVLTLTLTVPSSHSLRDAWRDLETTTRKFLANGWLSALAEGWARETEITWSPATGWHAHSHWLVFLETSDYEAHATLGALAVERWINSAARAGSLTTAQAQNFRVTDQVWNGVLYATKQTMTSHDTGSYALGNILAAAQRGDGDAWEAWAELEAFTRARKRWRARSIPNV